MSDSQRGNPIQVAVIVLLLVGGGWYFFRHYEIDGLDGVSVYAKGETDNDPSFVTYRDSLAMPRPGETLTTADATAGIEASA